MMDGATGAVGFEAQGAVGVVEIRREAKRNSLTRDMWIALRQCLVEAARRNELKAVVIRGAGSVFSAGCDIDYARSAIGNPRSDVRDTIAAALEAIAEFPLPTIARIEGLCFGGACGIALACDIRLAHPETVFSIPAAVNGIVFDDASARRLAMNVGPGHTARLLYSSLRIDGNEATRIGLVQQSERKLDELVDRHVAAIGDAPRQALVDNKAALRSAAAI